MFSSIFNIFFTEKTIKRFIVGVVAGLAFSISVILATIGIMDGFEHSLKKGLKQSIGDLYFYSVRGPFKFDQKIKDILKEMDHTSILQTEGFVVSSEISKGVLVKGIHFTTFEKITGEKIKLGKGEVAIGHQLATVMGLVVGDDLILALSKGNRAVKGLPDLKSFRVGQIFSHGIYEKDLRIIYIAQSVLQKLINVGDKINVVTLNIPGKDLEEARFELSESLGGSFRVKTFWHEFGSLLEAVEVEKILIGLIFQLVVVISVFNVLAFIIFLNEKKSQEIFLLRALGLNQRKLLGIWLTIITGVWFVSCGLSVLLVAFFNYLLTYVSIFKVPGEIYHLGRLNILLTSKDYILVFGLALVWLLLVFGAGYIRLRKRPILEGLRKEFA
ncbi:MAG: ABC transporter permease [Deltaproteobacteria bacterium]|nr:MAG: ABC transporter permease [Deltaproteobacteria bacterium]